MTNDLRTRVREPVVSAPKRCWFHRWRDAGWDGFMTLVEECEKCHWQRVFSGVMSEFYICPPGTYERKDAS